MVDLLGDKEDFHFSSCVLSANISWHVQYNIFLAKQIDKVWAKSHLPRREGGMGGLN